MNNSSITTLVCWQTRKHIVAKDTVEVCKNYGLKPLIKGCYIGTLTYVEREKIERFFHENFVRSTDLYTTASITVHQLREMEKKSSQLLLDSSMFEIV